ncbi:MAG: hypothetical protein ABJA62_10705, partial [Luteimonas sp.]
ANEGTTNVTINCAFETEINQSTSQLISVFIGNSGTTDVDVTCTGITGWEFRSDMSGASLNEYLPVTLTVPAGAQSDAFLWQDTDFTNATGGLITVACTLPPGTAINDSYVDLLTDDAPTTP